MSVKKFLHVFIISGFITVNLAGADAPTSPPATPPALKLNLNYCKSYFTDIKKLIFSPFHWKREDWLLSSIIGATTLAIYSQEEAVARWMHQPNSPTIDGLAETGHAFGEEIYLLSSMGLLYLGGLVFDHSGAQHTALLGAKSMIITGLFVGGLKAFAHRHSPGQAEGPYVWDGPVWQLRCVSFPSGHAALAFSMATFMAHEAGKHQYIAISGYTLALLTTWARVQDEMHWPSDVFAGAVLGHFITKAVLSYSDGTGNRVAVMPCLENRGLSGKVIYRF